MPVKLKIGNRSKSRNTFGGTFLRGILILALAVSLIVACIFGVLYFKYQKVVDDRLASGPLFANSAQIYSGSREVRTGQHLTAGTIAHELKSAGYNSNNDLGTFQLSGDSIQIKPGPQSFHSTDGATIATEDGVVTSITAENGASLQGYKLEPQLITALSEDKGRVKRRLVKYDEIPPRMVEAVTSIEDRRFFEHGGVNYLRLIKCGVTDLVSGKKRCGGSTLTQQLAKNLFLSPEKSYKRKMIELLITFQLEARFNKQQLFEMYVNEMNLGHRGSVRDQRHRRGRPDLLRQGLSPARPGRVRHPRRHVPAPELLQSLPLARARHRAPQYRPRLHGRDQQHHRLRSQSRAKAEPLHLAPPNVDASEAPYFVDLVHDQLVQRIGDQAIGQQSLRIYTSLDPDLQRAASEAVEAGMKNVDELIRKRHRAGDTNITYPQVALVAIDPHTGQILALVGGRNYTNSQLDHAVAERPTGSIFKPFVYATAYNTSLNGTELDESGVFTALTKLNNDAQDFGTGGQSYVPGNFEHGEYPGMVPAVQAIAHSLNIATIALAQKVGYENVAALARSSGITNARGTPSVAIGTYNATPIDMAGAYTVFANNGVHLKPWLLASVRNPNGDIVADYAPEAKQVLDPRTAYLTQSLMENVMTFGTGASARAHGFTAPAAGKTGTSHDVWFAGYSSNLLCVIWVGNDDYTDISRNLTKALQGADAAAPIWAEFMNRAIKLPQYSDMKSFTAPSGVQRVLVDKATYLPADASCPADYSIAFLDGTVPQSTCSHMGESQQNFFQKLFGIGGNKPEPQPTQPNLDGNAAPDVSEPPPTAPKKNIFKRLFGSGDKPKTPPPDPNAPPQ